MKTFDEFITESDSPTSTTDGVASPDIPMMKIKRSKFMGEECVDLDDDSYYNCIKGKVPFDRWSNYIEDEDMRKQVKSLYHNKSTLMARNTKTGAYAYIK